MEAGSHAESQKVTRPVQSFMFSDTIIYPLGLKIDFPEVEPGKGTPLHVIFYRRAFVEMGRSQMEAG